MSRLDEELEAVLSAPVPTAERARPTLGHKPGAPGRGRRGWLLLLGLLALGGLVLGVALTSFREAAVYSKPVDALLTERARFTGRVVKVVGALVPGTLVRRDEPCEYRFRLKGTSTAAPALDVRFPQCVIPDTFRDVPGVNVEVTAEGKLLPEGHFVAHQIMAKCPSKYEMRDRSGRGETAPHTALGPGADTAEATARSASVASAVSASSSAAPSLGAAPRSTKD